MYVYQFWGTAYIHLQNEKTGALRKVGSPDVRQRAKSPGIQNFNFLVYSKYTYASRFIYTNTRINKSVCIAGEGGDIQQYLDRSR